MGHHMQTQSQRWGLLSPEPLPYLRPCQRGQALTLQAGHRRILYGDFESSKNTVLKIVTWGGGHSQQVPPQAPLQQVQECFLTHLKESVDSENVYLGLWYISKVKKTNRTSRYQVTQEFLPRKWKQMSTQFIHKRSQQHNS